MSPPSWRTGRPDRRASSTVPARRRRALLIAASGHLTVLSAAGCPAAAILAVGGRLCSAARLLNDLTGLAGLVAVHQGDATDVPVADATFDLVWMQNVSMNIADKPGLYREARRVLRAGGRITLQEVVAGPVGGELVLRAACRDRLRNRVVG